MARNSQQFQFPVSLEEFKKCIYHEELVETLIRSMVKGTEFELLDMKESEVYRNQILKEYYELFYINLEIRNSFPVRFKPMPRRRKDKIFQVATPLEDPPEFEEQSSDWAVKRLKRTEVDTDEQMPEDDVELVTTPTKKPVKRTAETASQSSEMANQAKRPKTSNQERNEPNSQAAMVDTAKLDHNHGMEQKEQEESRYTDEKHSSVQQPQQFAENQTRSKIYKELRKHEYRCPVSFEEFEKYTNITKLVSVMCQKLYGNPSQVPKITKRSYLQFYLLPEYRTLTPFNKLHILPNCPENIKAKIYEFPKPPYHFVEHRHNVDACTAGNNENIVATKQGYCKKSNIINSDNLGNDMHAQTKVDSTEQPLKTIESEVLKAAVDNEKILQNQKVVQMPPFVENDNSRNINLATNILLAKSSKNSSNLNDDPAKDTHKSTDKCTGTIPKSGMRSGSTGDKTNLTPSDVKSNLTSICRTLGSAEQPTQKEKHPSVQQQQQFGENQTRSEIYKELRKHQYRCPVSFEEFEKYTNITKLVSAMCQKLYGNPSQVSKITKRSYLQFYLLPGYRFLTPFNKLHILPNCPENIKAKIYEFPKPPYKHVEDQHNVDAFVAENKENTEATKQRVRKSSKITNSDNLGNDMQAQTIVESTEQPLKTIENEELKVVHNEKTLQIQKVVQLPPVAENDNSSNNNLATKMLAIKSSSNLNDDPAKDTHKSNDKCTGTIPKSGIRSERTGDKTNLKPSDVKSKLTSICRQLASSEEPTEKENSPGQSEMVVPDSNRNISNQRTYSADLEKYAHLCPVPLNEFKQYTNIVNLISKGCKIKYGDPRKNLLHETKHSYWLYFLQPESRNEYPLNHLKVRSKCPEYLKEKILEIPNPMMITDQIASPRPDNGQKNRVEILENRILTRAALASTSLEESSRPCETVSVGSEKHPINCEKLRNSEANTDGNQINCETSKISEAGSDEDRINCESSTNTEARPLEHQESPEVLKEKMFKKALKQIRTDKAFYSKFRLHLLAKLEELFSDIIMTASVFYHISCESSKYKPFFIRMLSQFCGGNSTIMDILLGDMELYRKLMSYFSVRCYEEPRLCAKYSLHEATQREDYPINASVSSVETTEKSNLNCANKVLEVGREQASNEQTLSKVKDSQLKMSNKSVICDVSFKDQIQNPILQEQQSSNKLLPTPSKNNMSSLQPSKNQTIQIQGSEENPNTNLQRFKDQAPKTLANQQHQQSSNLLKPVRVPVSTSKDSNSAPAAIEQLPISNLTKGHSPTKLKVRLQTKTTHESCDTNHPSKEAVKSPQKQQSSNLLVPANRSLSICESPSSNSLPLPSTSKTATDLNSAISPKTNLLASSSRKETIAKSSTKNLTFDLSSAREKAHQITSCVKDKNINAPAKKSCRTRSVRTSVNNELAQRLESVKEKLFKNYSINYSLPYMLRMTYGLRQRIIEAVLDLTFADFTKITHIYQGHELYHNSDLLCLLYEYVFKTPRIWPENLFICLKDICQLLELKKIAVPNASTILKYISPRFLHWSNLIKDTNFVERVCSNYRDRFYENLDIDDKRKVEKECIDYYQKCWMLDQWIGDVPTITTTLAKMVMVQENTMRLDNSAIQEISVEHETRDHIEPQIGTPSQECAHKSDRVNTGPAKASEQEGVGLEKSLSGETRYISINAGEEVTVTAELQNILVPLAEEVISTNPRLLTDDTVIKAEDIAVTETAIVTNEVVPETPVLPNSAVVNDVVMTEIPILQNNAVAVVNDVVMAETAILENHTVAELEDIVMTESAILLGNDTVVEAEDIVMSEAPILPNGSAAEDVMTQIPVMANYSIAEDLVPTQLSDANNITEDLIDLLTVSSLPRDPLHDFMSDVDSSSDSSVVFVPDKTIKTENVNHKLLRNLKIVIEDDSVQCFNLSDEVVNLDDSSHSNLTIENGNLPPSQIDFDTTHDEPVNQLGLPTTFSPRISGDLMSSGNSSSIFSLGQRLPNSLDSNETQFHSQMAYIDRVQALQSLDVNLCSSESQSSSLHQTPDIPNPMPDREINQLEKEKGMLQSSRSDELMTLCKNPSIEGLQEAQRFPSIFDQLLSIDSSIEEEAETLQPPVPDKLMSLCENPSFGFLQEAQRFPSTFEEILPTVTNPSTSNEPIVATRSNTRVTAKAPQAKTTRADLVPQKSHTLRPLPVVSMGPKLAPASKPLKNQNEVLPSKVADMPKSVANKSKNQSQEAFVQISPDFVPDFTSTIDTPVTADPLRVSQELLKDKTLFNNTSLLRAVDHNYTKSSPQNLEGLEATSDQSSLSVASTDKPSKI